MHIPASLPNVAVVFSTRRISTAPPFPNVTLIVFTRWFAQATSTRIIAFNDIDSTCVSYTCVVADATATTNVGLVQRACSTINIATVTKAGCLTNAASVTNWSRVFVTSFKPKTLFHVEVKSASCEMQIKLPYILKEWCWENNLPAVVTNVVTSAELTHSLVGISGRIFRITTRSLTDRDHI